MQRVRIGLTGLALVFVLVLLGAVIRSASDDTTAVNAAGSELSAIGAENVQAQPTEPLAELGVAPGNVDANTAAATSGASKP